MTAKQFFKSTAFKCIITLLCVLLVCGVFLTVMNGLLEVTPEEKFNRAINKIYGKSVSTEKVAVANYNDNATIDEAYKIKDDGNYLIKSTGKGGFDNGTVTCWIVIEVKNNAVSGIGKVVVDSNKSQSYIGNINDKFLSAFSANYDGGYFSASYAASLKTGATRSATAICNAVNGALDFVNAQLGNAAVDIYEGFAYTANIQTKQSSHVVNADESVTFTVVSKGYGMAGDFTSKITVDAQGVITEFEIITDGSTVADPYGNKAKQNVEAFKGKDLEGLLGIMNLGAGDDIAYPSSNPFLVTGATNSSYSLYNAALFAAANYREVINNE